MYSITPTNQPIDHTIEIPGSKYIANRAVVMAALARGESNLYGVPYNEDIETAINGLSQLGARFEKISKGLRVHGIGRQIDNRETDLGETFEIFTSASGTFSRFITSAVALFSSSIALRGTHKMNTRPMGQLFQALKKLRVKVTPDQNHLPVTIQGPLQGGRVSMLGNESSQYFSSLLIAGALAQNNIEINVEGHLVSRPYINMSIDLMRHFGVKVDHYSSYFVVPGKQQYFGAELSIECDPVSSSYFLAATCLLGGQIKLPRFNPFSVQGEAKFYQVLVSLGAKVRWENEKGEISKTPWERPTQTIILEGPGYKNLKSIEIDMGDMPDVVQTLAVMMAFAKGTTKITNIAHLKYKESDRVGETAEELSKLGIQVQAGDDYLIIEGGNPRAAVIHPREDHRMAMSFALAGMVTPGIKIEDHNCVAKSFPTYWETLSRLGIQVT